MKSFLSKYKLGLLAVAIMAALFIVFSFYFLFGRPSGDGSVVIEYDLRAGLGSYSVAKELEAKGIVKDSAAFRFLLRATGRASRLKAGLYELNNGMSPERVATVLTEGKVQMKALTVPEGWNNRQIADYLAEKGYVKDRDAFMELTKDPVVLQKYRIVGESTEGYLFPDTYMVPVRYSAEKIQEVMLRRFFAALEEAGIRNVSPEELHQKVILASIIEREAAHPEELPTMAAVFLNRINKRMRLESCATVQYLFPKSHPKLYDKDLQIQSPYNTYKHRGLPPGPISNPGLNALRAAFHPDNVPYLFFVLKPDGYHHFSTDYSDHVKAKKRYLD